MSTESIAMWPKRILLATDLTSGCDRALDRAVELAHAWQAELHLVHAISPHALAMPAGVDPETYARTHPDPRSRALRRLQRLFGDVPAQCHVEIGPAAAAILDVSARIGCELVVLGESHAGLVGPIESTVERVVRASPVSTLVVRERPRSQYRRIIVGTDFTDEARQALETAVDVFPDAAIHLVHAAWMPYAGLLDDNEALAADVAHKHAALRDHLEASGVGAGRRPMISLHAEAGPPALVLRRIAEDNDADLVVIGAHARGLVFDAVLGASRSIVQGLAGDVLILRAARTSQ